MIKVNKVPAQKADDTVWIERESDKLAPPQTMTRSLKRYWFNFFENMRSASTPVQSKH